MSISNDYSSSYGSSVDPSVAFLGQFFGILAILIVILIIGSILVIISWWKIFKKFNKPGWYSLIPFLNMYTFLEIVDIPGWISFIPFIGNVFTLIAYFKLCKKLGKGIVFAIGLFVLPFIFFPILGFGKSKVVSKESSQQNINGQNQYNMNQSYNTIPQPNHGQQSNTNNLMNQDTISYKYCPNCGNKINNDANQCFMCGNSL